MRQWDDTESEIEPGEHHYKLVHMPKTKSTNRAVGRSAPASATKKPGVKKEGPAATAPPPPRSPAKRKRDARSAAPEPPEAEPAPVTRGASSTSMPAWARLKGFPSWPAQVVAGGGGAGSTVQVEFYGTHDTAEVQISDIVAQYVSNLNLEGERPQKGFRVLEGGYAKTAQKGVRI